MGIRKNQKGKKISSVKNNNSEEKIEVEVIELPPTSLLEAFDRVGLAAKNNDFNKEFLLQIDPELSYLSKRLGISKMQAFLLGVCIDNDFNQMTVKDFAQCLDITNAQAISLLNDLTTLVHLRLLSVNNHFCKDTYSVPTHVLKLLARNEDYKAPRVTGLDANQLLSYIYTLLDRANNRRMNNEELQDEVLWILKENTDCQLVKALNKLNLKNTSSTFALLLLCAALNTKGIEKVRLEYILQYLDDQMEASEMRFSINEGYNELVVKELIEPFCEDGIADPDFITLTKKGHKQLLVDVKIGKQQDEEEYSELFENNFLKLIKADDITPKSLFYEPHVNQLVSELNRFFEADNYNAIVERMKQCNFRSAFTCIFYGGPGTGKTETVYQIAKESNRDILIVDVPQIKDKWVGESEKNIKSIFDQYRALAKKSTLTPILLFNEADSIFCKRLMTLQHSSDQMLNTMQNIILQEMETLEGILIATTNLTENLDAAFERRFLYKIKFDSPGAEVRGHIWHTMIPSLSDEQAAVLAERYEFSGGQIENVARKFTINNILCGVEGNDRMETLFDFCNNELIQNCNTKMKRVGF